MKELAMQSSSRTRLGDYLELVERPNVGDHYGIEDVRGVNNQKLMIRTKADLSARDLSKFQVVEPGEFFFNHRTSRNGSKFSITYNYDDAAHIVTEDYVVFRVADENRLSPSWLYLYVCRTEYDRHVIQNSWGSSTEFFNWEDLCDTEIELPPIEIQRKYAAIYEAMLANQRAYEQGLDDLKLTCDALLDRCKKSKTWEPVGKHLREVDVRNTSGKCDVAYGINIKKEFMLSKASSNDLLKYKLVKPKQLAYSAMQTGRDKCIRIALNESSSTLAVSPAYSILEPVDGGADARYVMMWFSRAESDRYGWFLSDASIRANLDLNSFLGIEMPIPESDLRDALCDLYSVLRIRSDVNDRLKSQLKDICPILIRGSIEEASRQ